MIILGLTYHLLAPPTSARQSYSNTAAIVNRGLEPVTVTGIFPDVPLNQIFVYREIGGSWEQIPFQIDEKSSSGTYVGTEDNLMDINDEIVFMAQDLGVQATTSITGSLPISPTWHEIEVSDPLNSSAKGWVYIVRSTVLSLNTSTDYVSYSASNQRVSATNYTFDYATNHAGLNNMTLFGGSDILDRTKVRIKGSFMGFPFEINESDLPAPAVTLVKDGLVRVISKRGSVTTLAYASYIQTETIIDFSSQEGTIKEARLSTDLNANAVNGTFYNENTPSGVTINGSPDPVKATPLNTPWRQVSLNSGTTIQVFDLEDVSGTVSYYYKDNSATDSNDTGDQKSYGDSGIKISNPTSKKLTYLSIQYILSGKQGNKGATYYQYVNNPLEVHKEVFPAPNFSNKVYLPIVFRK
ncbi:MAG: hypothetical protein KDJ52_18645 [Anaerolineae bacterium]|nr:hypothetical protein [Anaerolineae bacterium]